MYHIEAANEKRRDIRHTQDTRENINEMKNVYENRPFNQMACEWLC